MVVVDAVEDPATDLHPQSDLLGSVLFVRAKVGALHQLCAEEFPRPVTMLADRPCRTEALHRGGDGDRVVVEEQVHQLPGPGELVLQKIREAGAHVALHAFDVGMGRRLIGNVFGGHGVAERPAEGTLFRVPVPGVSGQDDNVQEHRSPDKQEVELPPVRGFVEIEASLRDRFRSGAATLPPGPEEDEHPPECDHPREKEQEQPHVGAVPTLHPVDDRDEEDEHQTHACQVHPGITGPVLQKIPTNCLISGMLHGRPPLLKSSLAPPWPDQPATIVMLYSSLALFPNPVRH